MSMRHTQKKGVGAKQEADAGQDAKSSEAISEANALVVVVRDKDGLWGAMRSFEKGHEDAKKAVLAELRRMVDCKETSLDLDSVVLGFEGDTEDSRPTGLRASRNKHWRDTFEASDEGRELRALRGEPDPVEGPEGNSGGVDATQGGPRILAGLQDLCDHLGADTPEGLNGTIYRNTSCGASLSLYYENGFALHNGDTSAGRWKNDRTHEQSEGISWSNPGTPYGFTIQTIVEGSDATVDSDVFKFPVSSQEVDDWIKDMESRASELWLDANGRQVEVELELVTSIPAEDLSLMLESAIDERLSYDDEPLDGMNTTVGEATPKGSAQVVKVGLTVGWESEEEIAAFFRRAVKDLSEGGEVSIAGITVTECEEEEDDA